ncbi:histone-lysine N-methyltransferase ATXR2 [Humulus lupulus]|uniref:histone-lysine N-methyltransferase ATXR2 n=1 Tax=Humulus lupulus TaxID=3486 RepID=UPI002B404FBF|nr:histone-lysine N-methyltransferase ATXR2 [Humulus lupulus]
MEGLSPIDSHYPDVISALLAPPSSLQAQEYFDELISKRQNPGIKVKQNGEFGKGVCAETEFKEGELILKDQMLVGAQHSSNKMDCLVCSFCFRFIGSIELQIGRKLYLQELGVSENHNECDMEDVSSDGEDYSYEENGEDSGACSSSNFRKKVELPKGVVESLMNGNLKLPYSDKFPLPPIVPCIGGCGEAHYCSKLCAQADWESYHSLLCTGEKSESVSKEALVEFIQHANETNDIFILAAKAISYTILRYRKLKATCLEEGRKNKNVSGCTVPAALSEAWKPISMGHKRRWWDCIALPIDVESSDEDAFRLQIRSLASTSLELLKAAIFDNDCEPLFSLEIYGHIIGMFELNNLDLVVASPVEDYFLYIDDLPSSKKKETEEFTRPILEALGDDYSVCCQGTAFFPLQSCMNHSCCPNAKAFKRDADRDGQATILALKPICKGEEITISYVDEELPFEERQALLADYGFRCRCPKCLAEEP